MTRTSCTCRACRVACETMPGYLTPEDLAYIDPTQLAASDGATILQAGRLIKLPTLVPKQRKNGHCVFYKNGRCQIHEHAPYGCRMFEVCQPLETPEIHQNRQKGLADVMLDWEQNGPYSQLWRKLLAAKPLRDRKTDFEVAVTRVLKKLARKARNLAL